MRRTHIRYKWNKGKITKGGQKAATMYMGVIDVTPKSALTRRLQLERHNEILSWALRLQIQGG